MGTRLWVEIGLVAASVALAVVTLIWADWLELVFGLDPDGGSGAAEWLVVAVCAVIAAVNVVLARVEWRRARLGNGAGLA